MASLIIVIYQGKISSENNQVINPNYLAQGNEEQLTEAEEQASENFGNFLQGLQYYSIIAKCSLSASLEKKISENATSLTPEQRSWVEFLYSNAKNEVNTLMKESDSAIKNNPRDIQPYIQRGICYLALEEYKKAINDFTSVITIQPLSAQGYYLRAGVYVAQKQYNKALNDYDKSISLDDQKSPMISGGLFTSRGDLFYLLGKYKKAIKDYKKAIEFYVSADFVLGDIGSTFIYEKLSEAYFKLKDYESALASINKQIELNSGYPFSHYTKGKIYAKLGETEKASTEFLQLINFDKLEIKNATILKQKIEEIELLIADNKQDSNLYYFRGIVWYYLNEFERAMEDFNQAINLDDKTSYFYYARGLTHQNLSQDYSKAIVDFTQAIKLSSKNDHAYYQRSLAYFSLKEYETALLDMTKVMEINPEYASPYYYSGIISNKLENPEKSIYYFDEFIKLYQQQEKFVFPLALAYYHRAITYDKLGQQNKAISSFILAIDLFPYDLSLLYYDFENLQEMFPNSREIYQKNKDFNVDLEEILEEQLNELDQAINQDSSNAQLYYRRGLNYFLRKDYENALNDFSEAIKLVKPEDAGIFYSSRALTYQELGLYREAISDYTKLEQLNPNYSALFGGILSKASLYGKLKNYEEAINLYTQFIEDSEPTINQYLIDLQGDTVWDPDGKKSKIKEFISAYYNRGLTYYTIGQKTKAIADLKKSLSLYFQLNLEDEDVENFAQWYVDE